MSLIFGPAELYTTSQPQFSTVRHVWCPMEPAICPFYTMY